MKTCEKRTGLVRRWVFLAAGLTIMALGVALSIRANLGTSPISSVPYVSSLFSPLSVGNASIVMHCLMILAQILILRKQYEPVQLLQLPVAVVFGWLTDAAMLITGAVTCSAYWQQWAVCVLGILLVGIGVSFEVTAGVVTLAGEGTVLALCRVLPVKFGTMKVTFDVCLVLTACLLSLVFLGELQGVREGTVAAALCVGMVARQLNKPLGRLSEKLFA